MKISIITVSYNSSKTIKDTFDSILSQAYNNIEYIVVDGDSKDSTINIIKEYKQKFVGRNIEFKWISEKDKGLYDAMNKGIKMATGDIVGIINSDDVYNQNNILEKVVNEFQETNALSVYGDLVYVEENNLDKITRYWKSGKYNNKCFLFGWMPPHPSFFVKREVYENYGKFRLDMGTAADYEIMLRFIHKNKISVSYISEVIVRMRLGGASNANLFVRLKANLKDKKAWDVNEIKPYFFTLFFKPIRKIRQFFY